MCVLHCFYSTPSARIRFMVVIAMKKVLLHVHGSAKIPSKASSARLDFLKPTFDTLAFIKHVGLRIASLAFS